MNITSSENEEVPTKKNISIKSESLQEPKTSKRNRIFGYKIWKSNFAFVKRNFLHRIGRKSEIKGNLPAGHRPQNLLATLILTVGIAMIALDIPTYPWILELPNEHKWFFSAITDVGKSDWILLSTGLVMLGTMAFDWSQLQFRTRMTLYIAWIYSAFIFFVVAFSGIIALILKWSLGRARPSNYEELGAVYFDMFHFSFDYTSFPSGHSTTIAALGTALCLLFPSWLWFIVVIGFWLVVSRIMVSAHYPSDVIAGTLLGIAVTLWTSRFLALRRIGFKVIQGNGVRRFAAVISCRVCLHQLLRWQKPNSDSKLSDPNSNSVSTRIEDKEIGISRRKNEPSHD